ncbi:MAG: hypothetical protein RLY20_2421 [Verrucomicrobiota bacterium]|jgi:hypothetical protein
MGGILLAAGLVGAGGIRAATLTLTASADASLMQVAPTNSNGGQTFFTAGTTQNGPLTRGLVRFDLSALPTNAQITAASVVLTVVHVPAEPGATAPFSLHRMLKNWGEGTNVGVQNVGQGIPAQLGDATWTYANFNTNSWAAAGGKPGTDFFDFGSASQVVYDTVPTAYTFGPTTELAGDVELWLQNPALNFGWMLICDEEATIFTARRWGSRENVTPDYRPQLVLEYLIPPVITRAEMSGANLLIGFQASAGQSYAIEYRDVLTNAWQPLVNLGAFTSNTPVLFTEPAAQPQRFYRLRAF